jgi:hypothetical protein
VRRRRAPIGAERRRAVEDSAIYVVKRREARRLGRSRRVVGRRLASKDGELLKIPQFAL